MRTFIACETFPHPIGEVFGWHERPGAIRRLVPPWEPVRVVREAPDLGEGAVALMELDLLPAPFAPRWVARHTGYRPPVEFVDTQERGPFRAWTHHHRFSQLKDGTRLVDEVQYDLPLAELAAPLVQARLRQMFRYRHRQLADDLALHARLTGPRLRVTVTGGDPLVRRTVMAILTTGGHRVGPVGDASINLDSGLVAVGDRTVRVRFPRGGPVRSRMPLLASGRGVVNWISVDDFAGILLFALLSDARGELVAVTPNPLPRKEFLRHLPAHPGPELAGAPPAGYVFRHRLLGSALRHLRGRG